MTEPQGASRFCIMEGYRPNEPRREETPDDSFWTEERINNSFLYQFPVYRFAANLVSSGNLSSLVDIGCGPGRKLAYLHRRFPSLAITGLDRPWAIRLCREQYDFGTWKEIDLHDASTLPRGISADLVVCADVIEHLADPDVLLRALHRLAGPGGRIVLSSPDRDRARGTGCLSSPNPEHVREWNREELIRYLEEGGFDIHRHLFQFPVKPGWSRLFLKECLQQARRGLSPKYNQVVLLASRLSR